MISRSVQFRLLRSSLILSVLFLLLSPPGLLQAAAKAPDPDRLQLGSVSAMVSDLNTGEVLYAKYPDLQMPVASLTKVMTAVVVLESKAPLNSYLEIQRVKNATGKNAYSRLRNDSTLKRKDLLRIALMSSENLATYVLAQHHEGGLEQFVADMNRTAERLGMNNTHFDDPSGLSSGNVSTARDMSRLLREANRHDLIREYSTTGQFTARFRKPRYVLGYGNTNRLVHRRAWDISLSKTGYLTEAGRCLLLSARIDERPVSMVLLNSFGKLTHIGDAGRVKRWLQTGDGGRLATAAKRYQADRIEELLAGLKAPSKATTN